MTLPKRKLLRLPEFDYNSPGCYFITVCTKDKKPALGTVVVGTGLPDGPHILLTDFGKAAEKQLHLMADFYEDIRLDNYVIMPNHMHLLIKILPGGPLRTPVPTNSKISSFVGTFKRFCSKEIGSNIWQSRSYDHIVRDEDDYFRIWDYISNNPARWTEDRFFEE